MVKTKILIVEDEIILVKSIQICLEKLGYAISGIASSGEKAIQKAIEARPNLVLMDIRLDGEMDGIEAARRIKESLSIPVVYLTSYADDATLKRAMITEPYGYILKPFEDRDLHIVIEIAIYKHRMDEKSRKLSHAVEQSSNTIMITNTKGKIEYVNPRFTELTGYSIEEVIGKTPSILKSNATSLEVYKELWKAVESGNEWRGEFCNRKKSGELYWESASILPVKDDEGVITNFIAVTEDITEKKKMQEALSQTEKLKALGVITSGVAHDFNNILAIISGTAQLLQEIPGDDKKTADRLSTIRKVANDGAEIVRRMRMFMPVEKGVSKYINVNIKNVIEESVDFTMPRWKNIAMAGGIQYDIDMKGVKKVPVIHGNPSELREVLINMINNALDVMLEGGTILICTWSNDNNVYVSISDTGTGMTEEVKKKIFDPFFTTKRAKGSGLGMSVSYGIVKSHGGNIEVESKVGAGSTFMLTFPIDRNVRQPKVSPEQSHEIKTEKLRILVIDDENAICCMLKDFLSNDGHDVKSVISGIEAIKILKGEEFDLVLCDLVMPDISGYEVVAVLNRLEKRPIIGFMTGWSEKIGAKNNTELNVDFIIKKPFKFSELLGHINEALRDDGR